MFWIFKKKQDIQSLKSDCFTNTAPSLFNYNETQKWVYYYESCAVLNDAISRILDLFDPIKFKNFPNLDRLSIGSYIIYGNLYLGYTRSGATVFIDPARVSIINNVDNVLFTKYLIDGVDRFDYLGNPLRSDDMYVKLIHLKNQGFEKNQVLGDSFILPIQKEVEILLEGAVYSLALLRNGAKYDGLLTSAETMPEDNAMNIIESIKKQHGGSKNAGKTLFLNGDLKYTALSGQTNRDMDFKTLMDSCTTTIYNHFKIPLPMVSLGASTYNNFSEANSKIYANAVLPIAQNIIQQINNILKLKGNKEVEIDTDNLPMQGKFIQYDLILLMNKTGIFTINEIREEVGKEPLEGGDTIWNNSGTQPLAYMGKIDENLYPKN